MEGYSMKKVLGLFSVLIINGFVLYLIYLHTMITCSTMANNICHAPYEPSGTQLLFFVFSLPFYVVLGFLSIVLCNYFNLKKGLSFGIFIIWIIYFLFLTYVDQVDHYRTTLFYQGSLMISFGAFLFIVYKTYSQLRQLMSASVRGEQ